MKDLENHVALAAEQSRTDRSSTTAHTPGPWSQHDDAPRYGRNYAATVWGPSGPGHGLIADCRVHGAAMPNEKIANARLIAAAPDMLAVAQQFEELSEWLHSLADDLTCSDLCDKTYEFQGCPSGTCARQSGLSTLRKLLDDNSAAIAKATGAA